MVPPCQIIGTEHARRAINRASPVTDLMNFLRTLPSGASASSNSRALKSLKSVPDLTILWSDGYEPVMS